MNLFSGLVSFTPGKKLPLSNGSKRLLNYLLILFLLALCVLTISGGAKALTCHTSFKSWGSVYELEVTLTNDTDQPIEHWQVELKHEQIPNISGYWNAVILANSKGLAASNTSRQQPLAPGESLSFGYHGKHKGPMTTPTCLVNQQPATSLAPLTPVHSELTG